MQQFKSKQLPYFINSFRSHKFSGVIAVQAKVPQQTQLRKRVIAFHQGWMTYAGVDLITAQDLAILLGHQLKLKVMDSAIKLANKKSKNHSSIQEYFELLVRLELFKWEDIQAFMQTRILAVLEQLIPYQGTINQNVERSFDLHCSESQQGFCWDSLLSVYTQRQQQWSALAPIIPSLESVPQPLNINQAEASVAEHLRKWVDGQNSLVDIAVAMEKDPLRLAHVYYQWGKKGWLTCDSPEVIAQKASQSAASQQSTILSVDDSPVVQTLIKRAIGDRYQVLLADNAVDALNILNRRDVSLILLDVTMPDIDGLELCRTIRSLGKFQSLPIVMLTAKDGMFDKLKGQMAGATHYLTKPISQKKLLEVLDKNVSTAVKV
ncbi:Response regulator MprA [Acaryochloris thomasi RCC1774]|uniref:Response regulator MprA n=1 Tax=Acaryochloris thomasi RCC1774 TaxID=1764569 RepID=A0A2W1JNQ5_9CYAN|nr:response regulator [Acaryochloris thomasi]PZD70537.1 Response regulator MprA [Acaryochloris thomasi RCC1774]